MDASHELGKGQVSCHLNTGGLAVTAGFNSREKNAVTDGSLQRVSWMLLRIDYVWVYLRDDVAVEKLATTSAERSRV